MIESFRRLGIISESQWQRDGGECGTKSGECSGLLALYMMIKLISKMHIHHVRLGKGR